MYKSAILFAVFFAKGAVATVAQAYPTKPVRIISGSPGTSGDLLSRYLS